MSRTANLCLSIANQHNILFNADEHRPEGYDDNIGHVLALMMEIYKSNTDKQFLVIVGALADDKGNKNDMINIAGVDSDAIKSVSLKDTSNENEYTAYYAYMTSAQINALAQEGVKCLLVGSCDSTYLSEKLPSLGEWWKTAEQTEAFCSIYGDRFVLLDGSLQWSPSTILYARFE